MDSPLPLACQPRALLALGFVFSRLPPEAALLAAGVCRPWRAAVADATAWTALRLEDAQPMRDGHADELLRAMATRARGGLQTLMVCGSFARLLPASRLHPCLRAFPLRDPPRTEEEQIAFDALFA